jgi:nucleotide-binding universal stress UspA family protein
MIRNILVPVDGSSFSQQAVAPAVELARRAQAHVHIVQAHEDIWTGSYGVAPSASDPYADSALRQEETRALAELVDRCEQQWSLRPRAELLTAPVVSALDGYIRNHGIDLVVMTTHGRAGISRALLGSVADALIRTADVPLLLLRPREDLDRSRVSLQARHIVVPLDGSPLAEWVLGHAIAFARLVGASITLLHVSIPAVIMAAAMGQSIGTEIDGHMPQLRLYEYLSRTASRVREKGVTVDVASYTSIDAAQGILDYAATHGVDMIAMATHGRGGWSRKMFGSVTVTVLRNVMMPTLVYHPPGADAAAETTGLP